MATSRTTKVFLSLAGIIGVGIGGALLFAPAAFQAGVGIVIGDNINLLSEMRAPGGAILFAGVLIFWGAFNAQMAPVSLLISAYLHLSYGVGRVLSMMVDGMPHDTLVIATGYELVVGLLSLFLLLKLRRSQSSGLALPA